LASSDAGEHRFRDIGAVRFRPRWVSGTFSLTFYLPCRRSTTEASIPIHAPGQRLLLLTMAATCPCDDFLSPLTAAIPVLRPMLDYVGSGRLAYRERHDIMDGSKRPPQHRESRRWQVKCISAKAES
jgi:hypothetical protein